MPWWDITQTLEEVFSLLIKYLLLFRKKGQTMIMYKSQEGPEIEATVLASNA